MAIIPYNMLGIKMARNILNNFGAGIPFSQWLYLNEHMDEIIDLSGGIYAWIFIGKSNRVSGIYSEVFNRLKVGSYEKILAIKLGGGCNMEMERTVGRIVCESLLNI